MSDVTLCVSLCETADPRARAADLEDMLDTTCREAMFPFCERLYAGSYFCDNYLCSLTPQFHDAMRALCRAYDMRATLVVPIIGQALLDEAESIVDQTLLDYADVYDEVVVNDIARFLDMSGRVPQRVGIGRLFSKVQRDARYAATRERVAYPHLSAEALACVLESEGPAEPETYRPLVELDPVSAVVDVSAIRDEAPSAEIALHLPYCFATTGRNCVAASTDEPPERKFRLGRSCSLQCLRISQDHATDDGTRFLKHGRTFYFANPSCQIAGTPQWRIVYAARL